MISGQPVLEAVRAFARDAILDAWAVLMPTECSGCGRADRALCTACSGALTGTPTAAYREDLTVWSALDYSDVVGRVLVAYKDGGRTDAAPALAAALRLAVAAAVRAAQPAAPPEPADGGILLVTVPSSRRAWRARGFNPVDLLLRRAGLRATAALRPCGTVADQVGLGRQQRLDNRSGSLRATRSLVGSRIVLVDDIVTTGATLLEARRAIRQAGGEVVGAATVAQTRRRHPDIYRSRETD
ncbi:ComF family protein [Cryobacterium sp. SO1]|uniref:ComF family protein n=1 Tax=Cryobacterium sp. SO1 TaxID=1897061 RepID=UPI001022A4DD|nr:phosphoribosyltransferase family protein [Cryobacterium sp. SO1]